MGSESGQALVAAVCNPLAVGDFSAAREAILELPRGLPEASVLERLVIEREHFPANAWLPAFVKAWRQAGRPTGFTLLPEGPPALGGVTGLLALATSGNRPDDVAEQALTQVRLDAPLAQRLALLPLLRVPGQSAEVAVRTQAALRALLDGLAANYPGELYLQATALLEDGAPSDAPLSTKTLDALIAASSRPRGALTVGHLYKIFLGAFSEAGPVESRRRAFGDAVAIFPVGFVRALQQRIEATVRELPGRRAEAVGVLRRTATVMEAGRSSIERVLGAYLALHAAQIDGDVARAGQAATALNAERTRVDLAARVAIERWPLVPLAVEAIDLVATDEAAHLAQLSEG
jgi:hypothetical protein